MKIAFLPTTFSNQYAESSHITLILLARELKIEGHEVYVIGGGRKEFPRYEKFKGVSICRGPRLPFSKFLNKIVSPVLKLKELRRDGIEFNVIHSFSAARFFVLMAMFAKMAIKNKDVKIIYTLKSYSRFKLGNKFSRLLNLADIITVPTRIFAQDIAKRGCNKDKIKIIRSPINLEKFKSNHKKRLKIKDRFVLYYGNTSEHKGFSVLIESMKYIFEKNKGLKLILIIRYKIPEKYKKMIKSLGIEKNVIIIDRPINNIEDYVNSAEAVILPYKDLIATEGNPSCLLEAMACKTPVVTTNLPELREIVTPEQDVLMAKPGDVESLANEINRLIKNKKLQKKLVENAYKKSKQFDVKIITKQFIKLYEELLNGS